MSRGHTSRECRLCHRVGVRGFAPVGAEGWECSNDRECQKRMALRALRAEAGLEKSSECVFCREPEVKIRARDMECAGGRTRHQYRPLSPRQRAQLAVERNAVAEQMGDESDRSAKEERGPRVIRGSRASLIDGVRAALGRRDRRDEEVIDALLRAGSEVAEPHGRWAIVFDGADRVWLHTTPDVDNGWHEITQGYGTGDTWAEVVDEAQGAIVVLFNGTPAACSTDTDPR